MICDNKLLCIVRNILIVLVLVSALGCTILATVAIVCPNKLYSTNEMQTSQNLKQASFSNFRGWNLHSYQRPQNFFIES
jgi:hypothetical protein